MCSRHYYTERRLAMANRLSKLEFQVMEALWDRGQLSIREIQEEVPARRTPAYTTVQTMVYRMEAKGVVRRVKKVGNFHVFEAVITRQAAQRRLMDDLLSYFGGRSQPLMAHLIESGKLSLADVKEAEKLLKSDSRKGEQRWIRLHGWPWAVSLLDHLWQSTVFAGRGVVAGCGAAAECGARAIPVVDGGIAEVPGSLLTADRGGRAAAVADASGAHTTGDCVGGGRVAQPLLQTWPAETSANFAAGARRGGGAFCDRLAAVRAGGRVGGRYIAAAGAMDSELAAVAGGGAPQRTGDAGGRHEGVADGGGTLSQGCLELHGRCWCCRAGSRSGSARSNWTRLWRMKCATCGAGTI